MRIFLGLTEVANVAATLARGFRALGHETWTVVRSRNPFYPDSQYDVVLGTGDGRDANWVSRVGAQIRRKSTLLAQLLYASARCDVSIFLFGDSFLPRFLDYALLKRMGKRIVSIFLGSDIRYWSTFEQEMRQLGIEDDVRPFIEHIRTWPVQLEAQVRKVQAAEKYADLILSQPGYGQLQTRPYMRFHIPLDLSQLECHVPGRAVPVVVHAPSKRGVKGTEYVLAAVERLKSEGLRFEFRLIEKMPNAEMRGVLVESDIVVDQLFGDTVGMLATEGMATGNAVLAHYPAEHALVPPGCPVVHTTRYTLVEDLRGLITDQQRRCQLASAGRPYVERHNDHLKVAQQILDWLQLGASLAYDFTPGLQDALATPHQTPLRGEVAAPFSDGPRSG